MLHLSAWNYPPDKITLEALNHQVKRTLDSRFGSYFHNSIVELFNVSLDDEELKCVIPFNTEITFFPVYCIR